MFEMPFIYNLKMHIKTLNKNNILNWK